MAQRDIFWRSIIGLFLLLSACTPGSASVETTLPTTPTFYTGASSSGPVPDVKPVAVAYLEAWRSKDYSVMYDLLTSVSQAAIGQEEFADHYRGVEIEAVLEDVEYELLSSIVLNPATAQVSYRVTLRSSLVGAFSRETVMNLSLEEGAWRVQWDDALVLPELAGSNYLDMQLSIPARANIYDRQGRALVAEQANAVALGLLPDQMDPAQEETLLAELSALFGVAEPIIRQRYTSAPAGAGWYVPLGEVSADRVQPHYEVLSQLSGLVLQPYRSRYYFQGSAPHLVGYISQIPEDELESYLRRGYKADERVGQAGIERWGEPYLAGKRGGSLYVLNAAGQPVTRLAAVEPQPAEAIYTTLDREFQAAVQYSLEGFVGAAVVMERDTGRILALASSPDYDPNAFDPTNYNYNALLEDLFSDPNTPLYNRAAQGQYPLGSIFKIITMAAALESGLYTAESMYHCAQVFTELEGVRLYDWTYEYGLPASGLLTLPQGLIRSCNPWFYHIGLALYNEGQIKAVSDMARGFGLGSPTGILVVDERPGQVPDPQNEIDATNLSIGQGALLVSPLQVVDFIAAIGNGGVLYRPQVIERIAAPVGNPSYIFKPLERGRLPISQDTLNVIQNAMVGVIRSEKPRGTAWHVFTGLDVDVAGKTGTAQSGSGLPHAWFAGYTFEGREDLPDIAVVVIIENVGEGSDYAAPIFRRIVEEYFYGKPSRAYPWETSIGVPQSVEEEIETAPGTPGVTPAP